MNSRELINQYEASDESRGYDQSFKDLVEALKDYVLWTKEKMLAINPDMPNDLYKSIFDFHEQKIYRSCHTQL